MLADDAVAAEGKLFIHGGGWDTMAAATFPLTIPRIALIFTIEVEHHEFQTPHNITVELVDEDNQPAGIKIQGTFRAAASPLGDPGDSVFVSQVLRLEQQVVIHRPGSYRFLITVEGQDGPLSSTPLRVITAPAGVRPV
jgi:hypothetical protein